MDIEETSLKNAFQKADILYRLLESFHPLKSDNLESLIDKTSDPLQKSRLIKLNSFLSEYHFDESGKPSKYWGNFIHLLNKVTKDFLHTKGELQNQHILLTYLIDNLDDDLNFHFNFSAQQNEFSYETVFQRVSKRYHGKEIPLPAEAKERHDFTYGDRKSLKAWLKTADSREQETISEKLIYYRERHQMNAYAHTLDGIYEALGAIFPQSFWDSWRPDWAISNSDMAMMQDLKWEDELLLGIGNLWIDEDVKSKFPPETYKKIRNFLAHECDDILHLNRGAALLAMIFPDYNDFTKYVLRKATYDPEANDIGLATLYDTSSFDFQDNDYVAWGELLLDQGPKNFFYLKTAHLLDNIPRNDKGKILIGKLDRQLYDRVTDLLKFLTEDDLERYSDIKIVEAVTKIRRFKEECQVEVMHMADKVAGILDRTINGALFGKPGYSFSRLSYNDDRFFVVGRFTNSCEYMGGEWEATVKEGYRKHNSTYYCLFDPQGRIIAHTWAYIDPNDWDMIIFDGFEADQNDETVSRELLAKIVEQMNQDSNRKKYKVGSSALHLGYEEITTIRRDELEDHAVKEIHKGDILDIMQMIQDTPPASDDEHLKDFLERNRLRKNQGPGPNL